MIRDQKLYFSDVTVCLIFYVCFVALKEFLIFSIHKLGIIVQQVERFSDKQVLHRANHKKANSTINQSKLEAKI